MYCIGQYVHSGTLFKFVFLCVCACPVSLSVCILFTERVWVSLGVPVFVLLMSTRSRECAYMWLWMSAHVCCGRAFVCVSHAFWMCALFRHSVSGPCLYLLVYIPV